MRVVKKLPALKGTTRLIIDMLSKLYSTNIYTTGLSEIPDNPIIYVVNHFTRSETFFLPYVLHKKWNKLPSSLADKNLFVGMLGRYLNSTGTLSTGDPDRNEKIIKSLITNNQDWIVYPEGMMVKNKKILKTGISGFATERNGSTRKIHSGSAVFALEAEFLRSSYLKAIHSLECKSLENLLKNYGNIFEDINPEEVSTKQVLIIPISISYYPLSNNSTKATERLKRFAYTLQGKNSHRMANFEEEITFETSILSQASINIHFSEPIAVADFIKPAKQSGLKYFIKNLLSKMRDGSNLIDKDHLKKRITLTRKMMQTVYNNQLINLSHIIALLLFYCKESNISLKDLRSFVYLAIDLLNQTEGLRLHNQLTKDFAFLWGDNEEYRALFLENLAQFHSDKVILELPEFKYNDDIDNFILNIQKSIFIEEVDFHQIRIQNLSQVIFNEAMSIGNLSKLMKSLIDSRKIKTLKLDITSKIIAGEIKKYELEYEKYSNPSTKPFGDGKPLIVQKNREVGALLIHGLFASPLQMQSCAKSLEMQHIGSYSIRLAGHGTSPENLAEVTAQDWYNSIDAGFSIVRGLFDKVFVIGLSLGALLALIKVAETRYPVSGLIMINPALHLKNFAGEYARQLAMLNDAFSNLSNRTLIPDFIKNNSEDPIINYDRIPVKSVIELKNVSARCENLFKQITQPTLIIKSEYDDLIKPKSSDEIYKKIASSQKEILTIETDDHIITKGKNSPAVNAAILKFIKNN